MRQGCAEKNLYLLECAVQLGSLGDKFLKVGYPDLEYKKRRERNFSCALYDQAPWMYILLLRCIFLLYVYYCDAHALNSNSGFPFPGQALLLPPYRKGVL